MGKDVFTRSLYTASLESRDLGHATADGYVSKAAVTRKSEQQALNRGKLEPLVDPAGFGVIRLSLPRVEKLDDGRYELNVGCPMPIESRVDTTGSMGHNVDVAMRVLPDAFECWTQVLEGYDIQVATGIFGDVCDRFPLCRPQFEMNADKIVEQLSMMVPLKGGGDSPEDPDLGIFGAAYLCRHYINRIGLKGYDFTITDAPGRGRVALDQLKRVFGEEVEEYVSQNGHEVEFRGSIALADIWADLLDRAHAFVLVVGNYSYTLDWWAEHVGHDRVVSLPDTKYIPHVQAAIIGLTEGTLELKGVVDFLCKMNMSEKDAMTVEESLINIPIGLQRDSQNYNKIPEQGAIFAGKPDVWKDENLFPVDQAEEEPVTVGEEDQDDWV